MSFDYGLNNEKPSIYQHQPQQQQQQQQQHDQRDQMMDSPSYGQGGINYDYNYSMSDILSYYDQGVFTSANIGIFLCICGIAFNLILITLIMGSKSLRNQCIYVQILNVAAADLSFVVTVDCFSVYNDLHKWTFGTSFCKAWMILDVALPSVSIIAILFLNADRVLFMYKRRLHEIIVKRPLMRAFVLLYPWCISVVLVCSLWLGFSEVEPKPEFCVYGITKEAHTASTWLTVFLPAILIVVLIVFVLIAAFGDITNIGNAPNSIHHTNNQNTIRREEFTLVQSSPERSGITGTTTSSTIVTSDSRQHRRVVLSILTVDFVSLLLSLPFTAYSHVSPVCSDKSSCQSLITLFQMLSWMRSSVTCFRPLLFILLTQVKFVCVREEGFCCCYRSPSSASSSSRTRLVGESIRLDNTTSSSHNNEEAQHVTMTSVDAASCHRDSVRKHPPGVLSTSHSTAAPGAPYASNTSNLTAIDCFPSTHSNSNAPNTVLQCQERSEKNSVTFI